MANQMKDPPWPERHLPPVLENWIGDLWDWLRANRPLEGVGISISDTGSGLAVSIKDLALNALKIRKPFELADASTHNPDGSIIAAKVRVYPGDLAGQIPAGFSPGDIPPYLLPVAGTGDVYVGLTVDTDNGNPTSRFIDTGTTPDDDIAAGNYYLTLGSYNVGAKSVAVANSAYGPIAAQICDIFYSTPRKKQIVLIASS